jgi:NodT family efflux transporter outer membrane factor (OMF) lipoprotein
VIAPRASHALTWLAALAMPLAACTKKGSDFVPPEPNWKLKTLGDTGTPSADEKSRPVANAVAPDWWKLLGDPLLTALEARLAEGNLDLRLAAIRLTEARAQLGVADAAGSPNVNFDAAANRAKQSREGTLGLTPSATGPNSRLRLPYNLFQTGFDASWELDLWGRVARSVEAAEAGVTASEDMVRDVLVTSSAELARNYIRLRGAQRKLQITRANLDIAKQSLNLTQARAAGGLTTDLDVANAAALVATIEATLPAQEQAQAELVNAIALLMGAAPQTMTAELAAPRAVPPVPPAVPIGVPSELARRRPDIRVAEAKLHIATATTGVAVADFYPRVTLGGFGALQGLSLGNIADLAPALAYSFGPSVTLPIFDGGNRKRTLELREAQQMEAAITYQRTVLVALHEVDNALTAYATEQRRRAKLEAAVLQGRRALGLARMRYEQGVADFLQVLTAQRVLLASEQELADSTTAISTNFVQLYKALGGGWGE